ncbi:MAG TPA: methyl-accepting chemotaxis protein [Myxococcaceae bacterium]
MFPAILPVTYLLGILFELDERQILALGLAWIPPLLLILGVLAPLWGIHRLTDRALRESPADPPGARLKRILVLPRQLELATIAPYTTALVIFTAAACETYGRPLSLIGPTLILTMTLLLLLMVRQTVKVEELLQPLAVEEFERHPEARPQGSGFLWPRQAWYLPYVTSVILLAPLVALGVIAGRRVPVFLTGWLEELQRRGPVALQADVPAWSNQLLSSLVVPSAVILGWVMLLGAVTALSVARRQRRGSQAVERAVRALASGSPELPAWPATDELGDLAFATASALAGLEEKASVIASAARTVDEVTRELTTLVERQLELLDTQSGALQQTWRTAQEIQRVSELASQKARSVLHAAERAAELGTSGREAVDGGLQQLGDVREHVGEMAGQVRALQERAGRIGRITMVVKDLADQSSMVALNAAIEATRAGEHGRTFAVVAQQIRQLSDQSTTATEQVHGVLLDVEAGILEAVRLSNAGMERADSGLSLARVHGENLRKLTSLVEDNAASARQISAAVDQQAAGIAQIFQAITQLGGTMDRTVEAMHATVAITTRAQQAADEVVDAMAGYRWRPGDAASGERPRMR